MSEQQLREQLERLRAIVNEIGADRPDSLQRLNELIGEIEGQLSGGGREQYLTDAVGAAIRHFEIEHPRATAVLNDLMVTLANMGI